MPTPRKTDKTASESVVVSLPTMTNAALIDGYIRQQTGRWRPETIRVRRTQLGRIAAAIPVPLAEATEEHLLAWHARGE